jgi:glucokinase
MTTTIAVDAGATKITAALVHEHAVVHRITYDDAVDDYDHSISVITSLIEQLNGELEIAGVGVAVAGFLNADRTCVLQSLIPGWTGRCIVEDLRRACRLDVVIENDGNAAAWGEYVAGAGRGSDPFVLLTLGSGVGGGIIIDGQILHGAHGIAAELGHILSIPGGRRCGCGGRGCLEQYGSGRALMHDYASRLGFVSSQADEVSVFSPETRRRLQGCFAVALERQDGAAAESVQSVGIAVGGACDRLARVLDPARIAIGGGLSAIGQPLLDAVRAGVAASPTATAVEVPVDVVLAAHGADAALIGMGDLVIRAYGGVRS